MFQPAKSNEIFLKVGTPSGTTSCRKKKRKGAVDGGGSSKMTTS